MRKACVVWKDHIHILTIFHHYDRQTCAEDKMYCLSLVYQFEILKDLHLGSAQINLHSDENHHYL